MHLIIMRALYTPTQISFQKVLISVIFEHVYKGAKHFCHLLKRDKLLVFSVLPPSLLQSCRGI